MILEYNQYKKYLDNEKFMKYFHELNDKIKEYFPQYNLNLELIIDKIYLLYFERYTIDDAINKLYLDGKIFTFTSNVGDS